MRRIKRFSQIADHFADRHVVLHSGASEPAPAGSAFASDPAVFSGMTLSTFMPLIPCPYAEEGLAENFVITTLLPGSGLRKAVNAGRAGLYRRSLHSQAKAFAEGEIVADTVVLQCAPGDARGFNLGPSVDVMPAALWRAKTVIVVENPSFPVVEGGIFVPSDKIDFVLRDEDSAPGVLAPAEADDVDRAVAANVLRLLSDGITLEAGIGAIPETVLSAMGRLRQVTAHMGLINDAVLNLFDSGVLKDDRITGTLAAGSAEFYRKLARERRLVLRPALETNDSDLVAGFDKFTAVNGALQVDLLGNINGERLGETIISCPGGLADFSAGARRSPGGRSIIALRSTARGKDRSTIVAQLASDRPTLTGDLVDFIVTEYGIAEIAGQGTRERAQALSRIAHPDHRRALLDAATVL